MINVCIRALERDRRTADGRQTATPTPRSTPTPSIESDAARDNDYGARFHDPSATVRALERRDARC